MASLHEGIPMKGVEEEDDSEEVFGTEGHCLRFLCFRCPLGKAKSTAYRSLLTEDGNKEKWWEEKGKRAKELLLESMARLRWRALVNKLRCHNNVKKRKPVFRYDSTSYALNFDEGDDHGVEEPMAGRTKGSRAS
ncbi:uncharacterized protein [Elaeis guineensis]|uniref:uncharacterized protein n=1 Tax=Elaeis guineensis var. tenera TaxID=51953 RepID=UPI003C6D9600